MTIKSLFLALTMGLISLASLPTQADPQLLDRVAAVVDDDVVMQSELDQRIDYIRRQNRGANLPDNATLSHQVLERLVIESIQKQQANRAGIRISDAQLNEALERIAAQNKMTLPQFREAMEAEGVPFEVAREQIQNEMLMSRLQRGMVGEKIQITDQDVDLFLASEMGKMTAAAEYHLGHILVSVPAEATPDDFNKAEQRVRDILRRLRAGADFRSTAIAESDGRNALEGGDLGWRKETQLPGIFADVVPKLGVGQISEPIRSSSGFHLVQLQEKRGGNSQVITQYHVRHILVSPNELRDKSETEALASSLYQRLQKGGDFAALAREYSNDPGSATNGGDLGWANPGDMVPEFDNTMQQAAIGQVSAPFETRFGWHILQVLETRQSDIGADLQRNQIRQQLYQRRFEEELPIWLRKIRAEAYVDIKSPS
ncbi:peptidylprolyl isomerase [Parathalassolituus penaei]|uniref:Chaperone SurA n=1 Tax=Parathalassolituus penaei TaxID=2997323 RepID=A0A9X3EA96_9GAMM|nr:peptidylprolyl isomerase [Parathalassolituus penaei]MCY0963812.1 peptidylprolyl isomerase [Parathalassolituus penaei]